MNPALLAKQESGIACKTRLEADVRPRDAGF